MAYIKKCNRCGKEFGEGVRGLDSATNELQFTKSRNTRYGYDKLIHRGR